jgi:hypothetical protein
MSPPAAPALPDLLRAVSAWLVEIGELPVPVLGAPLANALVVARVAVQHAGVAGDVLRPTPAAVRAVMRRGAAAATAWADAGRLVVEGLRAGTYVVGDDLALTVRVGALLPRSTPRGRVREWESRVIPRWAPVLLSAGGAA